MAINFDRAFTVVNGISLTNVLGIFEGTNNPSLTGEDAPVGSLYLRSHTPPSVWHKIDTTDTDWVELANLNDILFLSAEVSGLENDITTLSGDIAYISGQISGSTTVDFIDDLLDVDTSTYEPITGDFLRWNGNDWIPSSSPEVTAIPASNNLVYAYDTTTQILSAINTHQKVTFNNTPIIEGWSYSAGDFTSQTGGAFMVTFEFNVSKIGGGNVQCSVKADKNGTEIAGSHNGMDITSNNTAFSVSRTFYFEATQNDVVSFLFAGNNTTARILPAPDTGGIVTPCGATLLIRRIV
jgi:hypothetical protein